MCQQACAWECLFTNVLSMSWKQKMQACFTLKPYSHGYLPLIWLSGELDHTETLLSSVIAVFKLFCSAEHAHGWSADTTSTMCSTTNFKLQWHQYQKQHSATNRNICGDHNEVYVCHLNPLFTVKCLRCLSLPGPAAYLFWWQEAPVQQPHK